MPKMTKEEYEKLFFPPLTKEEYTEARRTMVYESSFKEPIQDNFIFNYLMEVNLNELRSELEKPYWIYRDLLIELMDYMWFKVPGFHGVMTKQEQEHYLTIEETIKLIQCFTVADPYTGRGSVNPAPHILRYCKSHNHVNQEKFLKLLEWVYQTNKEQGNNPYLVTGSMMVSSPREIEEINNAILKIEIID